MTKIKMFSLSLVAFAIISCGGDTTETNTKTVGKNQMLLLGWKVILQVSLPRLKIIYLD